MIINWFCAIVYEKYLFKDYHLSQLIGYARVSRQDQDLNLQLDALIKFGCVKQNIFIDKISGVKEDRPGLDACLQKLQAGDTLIVWRLDRLGRSLSHLIKIVGNLYKQQIRFKSLCDGAIDTTTASGELMFNIFSSLAQFERRVIQERTRAGLDAARARGRLGGRKPITELHPTVLAAQKLHQDTKLSIPDICTRLKISKATLYRYLKLK